MDRARLLVASLLILAAAVGATGVWKAAKWLTGGRGEG